LARAPFVQRQNNKILLYEYNVMQGCVITACSQTRIYDDIGIRRVKFDDDNIVSAKRDERDGRSNLF